MDKFIDLLKLFTEKHLIPAVLSIALAIVGIAIIPDFLKIADKTGSLFVYGLLLFCVSFLLIELLIQIAKMIKSAKSNSAADRRIKKYEEAEQYEQVEALWRYVDALHPQEKKWLNMLLKNGNSPIEIPNSVYYYELNMINNDKMVAKTNKPSNPSVNVIRLTDSFYQALQQVMKKYGKISNFDLEDE